MLIYTEQVELVGMQPPGHNPLSCPFHTPSFIESYSDPSPCQVIPPLNCHFTVCLPFSTPGTLKLVRSPGKGLCGLFMSSSRPFSFLTFPYPVTACLLRSSRRPDARNESLEASVYKWCSCLCGQAVLITLSFSTHTTAPTFLE